MRVVCVVSLFVLVASLVAYAGPLTTSLEGEVDLDLDLSAVTLDWSCDLLWESGDVALGFETDWSGAGWDDLRITAETTFASYPVAFEMDLDPANPAFESLAATLELSVLGVDIDVQARSEPDGSGFALGICEQGNACLDLLEIGWNLDEFGNLVQTDSCRMPLTLVRVGMSVTIQDACDPLRWELLWTHEGFQDVLFEWGPTNLVLPGVRLAGQFSFAPDHARAKATPSLSLAGKPGLTAFAGLVWDEATQDLTGIDVYGLDLACDLDDARIRSIIAFAPGKVSLVPAPYSGLIGVVWPVPACCGQTGEASIGTYFTDSGLLTIGKVVASIELPLAETLSAAISFSHVVHEGTTLTLGWEASF